jgi:hypothetical protein
MNYAGAHRQVCCETPAAVNVLPETSLCCWSNKRNHVFWQLNQRPESVGTPWALLVIKQFGFGNNLGSLLHPVRMMRGHSTAVFVDAVRLQQQY